MTASPPDGKLKWQMEMSSSSSDGAESNRRHFLPTYAVWGVALVIAFLVAVTNFVMVWIDVKLVIWKFDTAQDVIEDSGVGVGALVLSAIGILYSGVATLLVCLVGPACAGSGLPETKGYLNGNIIRGMFEYRMFFVRTFGIIFSTSAGFPAGREGPMVCIGGFIGYTVVDSLAKIQFLKDWLMIDVPHEDTKWFAEARRIASTLGSAAGVATAFNAPLGGILYMLEEATTTSWAPETTFRALVCTASATLISRGLLNLSKADFHRLVIFEDDAQSGISWGWIDVPFFVLVAALVGLCAAGFTRALIFVWRCRRAMHAKLSRWQPAPKIAEVLFYSVVCNFIFAIIPLSFECVNGDSSHRRLGGGADVAYFQYDCAGSSHRRLGGGGGAQGGYNPLATLLLNGGEGVVKHLVSRSSTLMKLGPLAVALLVYGTLAMGMPGLAVPMGNFIPSMVIGSLIGRFAGEALDKIDGLHGEVALPGVYAMVGSAAMLGGFTHMTIAIVALLAEAGHDLSLTPPLMLGIFVAHVFSKLGNHHGYDEVLILLKGVPYLDAEIPDALNDSGLNAKDLCTEVPLDAQLPAEASLKEVQAVLDKHTADRHFPVVASEACIGLTRSRTLSKFCKSVDPSLEPEKAMLPLRNSTNPNAFRILEGMPVARFYDLFSKGVARIAYVVSKEDRLRGTLCRDELMQAIDRLHSHDDHHAKADSSDDQKQAGPHCHHFPWWIIWVITVTIAFFAAVTNFCMVFADVKLISWKFDAMQTVMTKNGVGLGMLCLIAFAVLYSACATCLVCFLAPICSGSGLPEIKGYLNGNHIAHMFEHRAFLVRALGIILSTASGFPAGREGPMVCIGGFLGVQVTHHFALPFVRKWVKLDTSAENYSPSALIVDEQLFSEAKRIGCALGGAVGVAVAFNAPLGGILYMFEEVTVTSWAQELTFRAVVCTACGALISRALLNMTKADFHTLVIFEEDAPSKISWDWIDVPFIVMLAAFVGLCASAFTNALAFVFSCRQKMHKRLAAWQPIPKVIESISYATFCTIVFCLMPLMFDCEKAKDADGHRRLGGGAGLVFRQYNCADGEHNMLATLLLNGGESAVKHLYSRSSVTLGLSPLVVAFFTYGILAMGMPGLAVPMGNFIPSMVLGSLVGRFMGEVIEGNNTLREHCAHPGVYAIVGSAAMLGGFTHMTIAIVALLTEAGHDISLIPLLMLSIFVAHVFATIKSHHGYDEVLIIRKGVPYLDRDPPHELDDPLLTTRSLCMNLPGEAVLPPEASVSALQKALRHPVQIFPIVSDGYVLGFTTSARLHNVLPSDSRLNLDGDDDDNQCFMGEEDEDLALHDVFSTLLEEDTTGKLKRNSVSSESVQKHRNDVRKVSPEDLQEVTTSVATGGTKTGNSSEKYLLKLKVIMNPVPFEIVEDMPAPLVYSLFSRGIMEVAVLVSKEGKFLGVLTRACFTSDKIALACQACANTANGKDGDDKLRLLATEPNAKVEDITSPEVILK